MSFKMEYFYKIVIVLAYIHTYLMQNRCVRKVFLAENEPDSGVKRGDEKGSYDDEIVTRVMNLLSVQTLGKEEEEQEKSEKEDSLEGVEEMGAVGGMEEMGAVGGMEETGAAGWMEEMEVGETSSRKRRLIPRLGYFQLENIKKSKGSSEEEAELEEIQEEAATSSALSSKDAPEEKPEEAKDYEINEFKGVLRECDNINFEINDEGIEEYLKARITGKEKISELNKAYPLNLGKGINFDNPRNPFGEEEEPEIRNETELREKLYFDSFMEIPLFEFLNNTAVGNLSLEKINSLYVQQGIKYLPCNNFLLEYLGPKNIYFNIEQFFRDNIVTYLSEDKCEICNFDDTKKIVIGQKNEENNKEVERLTEIKRTRELTYAERQKLRYIIFYHLRNMSYVGKRLSCFSEKRIKIKKDIALLLKHFSLPKNYIYKDVSLLACLHYTLSYVILILKPLRVKVIGKNEIDHRELHNTSGLVNYFIALLEFIETNSQLCQKFFKTYENTGGFYPRLKSSEDIVEIFNYLMIKRQLYSIIYNIGKFLSKFKYCEEQVAYYEEHIVGEYVKLTFSLGRTLNKARELYKR
ncbi:KELT protein [Plasmodium knowlesi strain H]|uniref:KELT protein n=1 Tax=Plasmodium knowlesi (strain H) TaxID=5851 RepID=A0A679L481_PLAKH|nr:KELT protein [Plasmodium knowlesi strain H]CAA9989787.1 KELT protein [Plasmodium knowlesi strain H]VVS79261.1 KELT protein [Plasmodium knowlesi strain H]